MFDRNDPQAPKFKKRLRSSSIIEGQSVHFETRLIPVGDPSMRVEWRKDGKSLGAGCRFKATNDFGYCALDILHCTSDDDGVYTCLAQNQCGQDHISAQLTCQDKSGVIEETQLPEGMESLHDIASLEAASRRYMAHRPRQTEEVDTNPPVFDLLPEAVTCEEGETAKFTVKISGYPRPRTTWWVNGAMIVDGSRFKIRYDGMIHMLEIPKCREFNSGTIRVAAQNQLGQAECSTSLKVMPKEDWRSGLKQGPRSIVDVELAGRTRSDLRGPELNDALRKPKPTVVELRQFERISHEKAMNIKDQEVLQAYQAYNTRHSQMSSTKSSFEPHMKLESDIHVSRAKYVLNHLENDRIKKENANLVQLRTN